MSVLQGPQAISPPNPTIAIVGAGRVGICVGVLLKRAGHEVAAASARSAGSIERAAEWLDCPVTDDPAQAAKGAGTVVIAVPDDAVAEVCRRITDAQAVTRGTFVIHTSGALGLDPLSTASDLGARTLAVHPLQAIPDVKTGIERIPGCRFGITCDQDLRPWADRFVSDLGGRGLWVPEADRPLYHLAAVMASNFLVTLAGLVQEVAPSSADSSTRLGSLEAYLPLMKGTLANIGDLGPGRALTGPVARGDAGTIDRHMKILGEKHPELQGLYRLLSEATLRWALSSGRLRADEAVHLTELLAPDDRPGEGSPRPQR